jgi:hypothetical protein
MDTKQNLKPELKEVYDRIMNTDVKTPAPKTTEKPLEQPKTPPAHTETPQPAAHTAAPSEPPMKHIDHDQSFAFSSKDHKLVSKDHTEKSSDKGQKISKEIIIALVVIFFIVYAGLCAVLLGVIQF